MSKKISKKELKVLKKIVLPFLERLIPTGVITKEAIDEFRDEIEDYHVLSYLSFGGFTLAPDELWYGDNDSIIFETYKEDKFAFKDALSTFVYKNLAIECDITVRDLFMSYLSSISRSMGVSYGFSDGAFKMDDEIFLFIMRDYDASQMMFNKSHVSFIAKGKSKYSMEIIEVFKMSSFSDMKRILADQFGSYLN